MLTKFGGNSRQEIYHKFWWGSRCFMRADEQIHRDKQTNSCFLQLLLRTYLKLSVASAKLTSGYLRQC